MGNRSSNCFKKRSKYYYHDNCYPPTQFKQHSNDQYKVNMNDFQDMNLQNRISNHKDGMQYVIVPNQLNKVSVEKNGVQKQIYKSGYKYTDDKENSPKDSGNETTIQHISERDPDDIDLDPTLNPARETMFIQRSIKDNELNMRRRTFYERFSDNRYLKRVSSSSTIFLDDSTVTRPHLKSTVKALAQGIFMQIKNRDRRMSNGDSPEIFDEHLHPVHTDIMEEGHGYQDPDQKTVYKFVRCLFQAAQLSSECAIVTMVYLERLLACAELELTPINWKRIVLCAIILASKVWDDQAVWNVDFCQILRDLRVDDVNELERQFLEIIQFNINIPQSVYAKYYFDVRYLADHNQPIPLSVDRAFKLEAYSRILEDPIFEAVIKFNSMKRWGSLDYLTTPNIFKPAILS